MLLPTRQLHLCSLTPPRVSQEKSVAEHKDEIAAADVYTKDTADYKYENYTELPAFTDKHQRLMSTKIYKFIA